MHLVRVKKTVCSILRTYRNIPWRKWSQLWTANTTLRLRDCNCL